jgi:Tripartite tricarboxylate transporter family receptor
MMMRRREFVTLLAGLMALPRVANAQAVDKLVRIIVGFPPGGGTDIVARILAPALQGKYAASVIVENKPGASARLAVEFVKNASPDGSVMLFTPDFPMTLYPHSFKSLNYDPVRDFVAVGPIAKSMLAFSVGPEVPDGVKTLSGFVAWCKANPDKASYATTSAGATPHFTGVMFASEAKVAMTPALPWRCTGLAGPLGRPRAVERQSAQRDHRDGKIGIDPRAGGDRAAALAVPAGRADIQGSRLQRRRRVVERRLAPRQYAERRRAGLERGDARSVAIQNHAGQPGQIRHRARVRDACAVFRDDKIGDRPLGAGGEGLRICRPRLGQA